MRIFEAPNPLDPFDKAIGRKTRDYAEALALASQLFFLKAQREGEIGERRALVARLHDSARDAARRGQHDEAMFLLDRKRRLLETITEDEHDLAASKADAREARRRLLDLGDALERLRRDRRRIHAGVTTQRLHDAADREIHPRLQAKLDRAREAGERTRESLDTERAIAAPDDLSIDLERRALM